MRSDAPIAIEGLWGLEFDNRGTNEAGTNGNSFDGSCSFLRGRHR